MNHKPLLLVACLGICGLVATAPSCWWTGSGTYQVSGYATFGCKVCEPIVP